MINRCFAAALLALSTCSLVAQQPSSKQRNVTYSPASPITPINSGPPSKQGPLVFPLFLEGSHFSSLLTLINNAAASTYADVTVRALDGSVIAVRRVQFTPHSQQQMRVGEIIEWKNLSFDAGSILVAQSSALRGPSIAGTLAMTLTDSFNLSYIDEEPSAPNQAGSQVL